VFLQVFLCQILQISATSDMLNNLRLWKSKWITPKSSKYQIISTYPIPKQHDVVTMVLSWYHDLYIKKNNRSLNYNYIKYSLKEQHKIIFNSLLLLLIHHIKWNLNNDNNNHLKQFQWVDIKIRKGKWWLKQCIISCLK
jgi:hypothetical protein